MNRSFNSTEEILLEIPQVVNYSPRKGIEVKPGIISPIYINLKYTLLYPHIRHKIIEKFSVFIDDGIDILCGIESGGTYFASAVADQLLKPIIFYRRVAKTYGENRHIIGNLPPLGSIIGVIDDVLATGLTISEVAGYFKKLGYKVKFYTVFSYGYEKEIGEALDVEIKSLSNFDSLAILAKKKGLFSNHDMEFLKDHVNTYKRNIVYFTP